MKKFTLEISRDGGKTWEFWVDVVAHDETDAAGMVFDCCPADRFRIKKTVYRGVNRHRFVR